MIDLSRSYHSPVFPLIRYFCLLDYQYMYYQRIYMFSISLAVHAGSTDFDSFESISSYN